MNRWLAAGVVALVFLSGAGVGSLSTLALSRRDHSMGRHQRRPDLLTDQHLLVRHLDLTADQVESLHALHRRAEENLRLLHPQLRAQIEAVRDAHLQEVYRILSDEQRQRLEQLLAERHRRRHRRR